MPNVTRSNVLTNALDARVTSLGLIRWAGIAAILAGMLFIGIQLIHPADSLPSVTSDTWFIVAILTLVMSVLSLIGITGVYAAQVSESGWPGLVGYVLFSVFWIASLSVSAIEAFVLPLLTTAAPQFVEGFIGLFGGTQSAVDLGVLQNIAPVAGLLYLLGGCLFGLATFRAGVLPRLAGALLAASAVVTLAAVVVPHPADRVLAVPMGVAFVWLGYSLWTNRGQTVGTR